MGPRKNANNDNDNDDSDDIPAFPWPSTVRASRCASRQSSTPQRNARDTPKRTKKRANTDRKPKCAPKRRLSSIQVTQSSSSAEPDGDLEPQEAEEEEACASPGTLHSSSSETELGSWTRNDQVKWQLSTAEFEEQYGEGGSYTIDAILRWRRHPRRGFIQYRVAWKGYPIYSNTWEPRMCFDDPGDIDDFWKRVGGRPPDAMEPQGRGDKETEDGGDQDAEEEEEGGGAEAEFLAHSGDTEAEAKKGNSEAARTARRKLRREFRKDKVQLRAIRAQRYKDRAEAREKRRAQAVAAAEAAPVQGNASASEKQEHLFLSDSSDEGYRTDLDASRPQAKGKGKERARSRPEPVGTKRPPVSTDESDANEQRKPRRNGKFEARDKSRKKSKKPKAPDRAPTSATVHRADVSTAEALDSKYIAARTAEALSYLPSMSRASTSSASIPATAGRAKPNTPALSVPQSIPRLGTTRIGSGGGSSGSPNSAHASSVGNAVPAPQSTSQLEQAKVPEQHKIPGSYRGAHKLPSKIQILDDAKSSDPRLRRGAAHSGNQTQSSARDGDRATRAAAPNGRSDSGPTSTVPSMSSPRIPLPTSPKQGHSERAESSYAKQPGRASASFHEPQIRLSGANGIPQGKMSPVWGQVQQSPTLGHQSPPMGLQAPSIPYQPTPQSPRAPPQSPYATSSPLIHTQFPNMPAYVEYTPPLPAATSHAGASYDDRPADPRRRPAPVAIRTMPSAPPLTISLMLYFGFEGDQRSVAANVWAADGHAAALPAELRHMNMRELHFTHTVPMQVIRHSFVSPTASQTRPKTSEIRPSDHIDINVNATKLAEISEILNDQDVALVCRFPDDSGRSGGAGRSWNTLIACTSKAQREQLPPGVEPISSGPTLILFTARMPPPPSTEPGRITNLISQAVNEYVHKHNKDIKSQNKDIRPRPIDAAALHHVRVASLVWKLDDIRGKIGQGYNIVFSGAISNHFWEPQTMRHVFTVCEGRSRAELGEDKVWNAPIVNVFIVNGAREHIAALEVKSPLAPHLCRAKRSTNINFYTFGFAPHLPEEICDVLTIAFPPRSGGIVALSLSAILAAIAPAPTTEGTNGKREVEEGEISSTPTLSPQKRSPPGVSLWALRDRLSPQWTVVLHPWVLAVLNHYLDSGRVPQLMEQLGLLPPEGSVPLDVLLDLENKLSELTSPLQPEEIAAPPFDDPPKPEPDDDPLPAIEELDKELYKTMILLQERSINEKRYHVVLAHNGMLAGESSSNGIEVLSLDKFTTEPFLDDE